MQASALYDECIVASQKVLAELEIRIEKELDNSKLIVLNHLLRLLKNILV